MSTSRIGVWTGVVATAAIAAGASGVAEARSFDQAPTVRSSGRISTSAALAGLVKQSAHARGPIDAFRNLESLEGYVYKKRPRKPVGTNPEPVPAPEIDASNATKGLALVIGLLLLGAERLRRRA